MQLTSNATFVWCGSTMPGVIVIIQHNGCLGERFPLEVATAHTFEVNGSVMSDSIIKVPLCFVGVTSTHCTRARKLAKLTNREWFRPDGHRFNRTEQISNLWLQTSLSL